ncbi:MAG: response regulator transcription factor [Methylococcales bacterium]|nr:response regulator transcription factor [Methylococcales bacterium]
MTEKIKIILVDDHAVVRAGFRMLLATSESIEVISEASRGEEAIGQYVNLKPDVVVMDLSMPGLGGLETIHRIVQRDGSAKILVFSVYHQRVYVNRALNAGAKGYITKNSAPEILIEAIVTIMQGQNYIEQGLIKINNSVKSQSDYQAIIHQFSPREFDVFRMLAQGMSVHKIAGELCLGYKTIANYATQIRKKLQVDTLIDLAHIAEDFGLM